MAKGKNKEQNKVSVKDNSIKELRHRKFYYSFLTLVLIFCLVQISYSAIKNISKLYAEVMDMEFWAYTGQFPSWKFFSTEEYFLVWQNHLKPQN